MRKAILHDVPETLGHAVTKDSSLYSREVHIAMDWIGYSTSSAEIRHEEFLPSSGASLECTSYHYPSPVRAENRTPRFFLALRYGWRPYLHPFKKPSASCGAAIGDSRSVRTPSQRSPSILVVLPYALPRQRTHQRMSRTGQ